MRKVWGIEVADTAAKWLQLPESADDDDTIDRLARLAPLSYEQQRKTAAG